MLNRYKLLEMFQEFQGKVQKLKNCSREHTTFGTRVKYQRSKISIAVHSASRVVHIKVLGGLETYFERHDHQTRPQISSLNGYYGVNWQAMLMLTIDELYINMSY